MSCKLDLHVCVFFVVPQDLLDHLLERLPVLPPISLFPPLEGGGGGATFLLATSRSCPPTFLSLRPISSSMARMRDVSFVHRHDQTCLVFDRGRRRHGGTPLPFVRLVRVRKGDLDWEKGPRKGREPGSMGGTRSDEEVEKAEVGPAGGRGQRSTSRTRT